MISESPVVGELWRLEDKWRRGEMSLSNDLWQANHDQAQACLNHPFVQGLADGSLSRDHFAYYVGQDAFFLQAFARAYTIAGVK